MVCSLPKDGFQTRRDHVYKDETQVSSSTGGKCKCPWSLTEYDVGALKVNDGSCRLACYGGTVTQPCYVDGFPTSAASTAVECGWDPTQNVGRDGWLRDDDTVYTGTVVEIAAPALTPKEHKFLAFHQMDHTKITYELAWHADAPDSKYKYQVDVGCGGKVVVDTRGDELFDQTKSEFEHHIVKNSSWFRAFTSFWKSGYLRPFFDSWTTFHSLGHSSRGRG